MGHEFYPARRRFVQSTVIGLSAAIVVQLASLPVFVMAHRQ